jgi:hypothetical protein
MSKYIVITPGDREIELSCYLGNYRIKTGMVFDDNSLAISFPDYFFEVKEPEEQPKQKKKVENGAT